MAEKLARPQFSKGISGYKPEEVDSYIEKLLDTVASLKEENEVLEEKIGVLAESLQQYREDEDSLREALLGAQKMGDSIIKNANNKAEITMREASVKAARIVEEAHQKVEAEKSELIRVQAAVADFKGRLIDMYREHIELVTRIPVASAEQPAVEEDPAPAVEEAPAEEPVAAEEIPAETSVEEEPAVDEIVPVEPEVVEEEPAAEEPAEEEEPTFAPVPVEEIEQEPVLEEAPAEEEPKERIVTVELKGILDYPEAGQDIFEEFERRKSEILNLNMEEKNNERRSKFSDLKFGDRFSLLDDDDF